MQEVSVPMQLVLRSRMQALHQTQPEKACIAYFLALQEPLL